MIFVIEQKFSPTKHLSEICLLDIHTFSYRGFHCFGQLKILWFGVISYIVPMITHIITQD